MTRTLPLVAVLLLFGCATADRGSNERDTWRNEMATLKELYDFVGSADSFALLPVAVG